MPYTVQQLADASGTTVRTLHHYDEIGLLKPARTGKNKYREYEEAELRQLQQILFFRELDFSLDEIKKIITAPSFDMKAALKDQRALLALKRKRLEALMHTIDKTLTSLNKKNTMTHEDRYGNFNTEELDAYAAEAKERWGDTEAYKQSQERVKKMPKGKLESIGKDMERVAIDIGKEMTAGRSADCAEVQALIKQHFENLRNFYEPSMEMYRNMGEMYVSDPRFAAYYEKYAKGLAVFMRDAMTYFADHNDEIK